MKAKAIKGKSPIEIKSELQHSMADGFKPTLAMVFISVKQDRKAVCKILHQSDIDVIGATSSGEFINDHQSEGEFVIILVNISRNDYCNLFEDIGDRSTDHGKAALVLNEAKIELKAEVDALLIFSCAGSLGAFVPMDQEENEGLSGIWYAQMVGFYTYGEYGKGLNGKHEFHSTT